KGKTPRNMLERHIGRGRLLEEAIDIVIPEAYNKALEDEDIDAIDQPKLEVVSTEPLSFKATVPIRPSVDLGDYTSVRVAREPVEVDEKDVEASLQELRQRYAIQEPVERPVQAGDVITAEIRIEVDVKEVKEERLPEPDDDFATQVGEGFESLAKLRERLHGDILERLVAQDDAKY